MNIQNKLLEGICTGLESDFLHYFDWNDIDLSFL